MFMQETLKVASSDDHLMIRQRERAVATHRKKMSRLFNAMDTNGSGYLNADEFQEMMSEPMVQSWLASMELDVRDADMLFMLADEDNDQQLSLDDLVHSTSRLKGPAKSVDLISLSREQRRMGRLLKRVAEHMGANRRISATRTDSEYDWEF